MRNKFIQSLCVALVLSTGSFATVWAQTNANLAEGEVRKIDKEAGKITIRHGELKSIDMPPMTMVFVVKDKAVLDQYQVGDKVKFDVAREGGKLVVTEIAPK